MKAAAALLFACGAGMPAFGAPTDELAGRAAELRAQHDSARSGKMLEYFLARSGLESCERALKLLARNEREQECTEAERRVEACNARRERWTNDLDAFRIDALAAGSSARHQALIKLTLPPCPSTLPDANTGPAEALAAENRRERQALPGFAVCESYLRAMISAADEAKPALVEGLALDLDERCGADHPDYRRQAVAALIRVGREPALLNRPRPAAKAASAASAP